MEQDKKTLEEKVESARRGELETMPDVEAGKTAEKNEEKSSGKKLLIG